MIVFNIEFLYKEKNIIGQVWESEWTPKQWHITVDTQENMEYIKGVYMIFYNENDEKYTCSFPSFDKDKNFMNALYSSLRKYLHKNGWESVDV